MTLVAGVDLGGTGCRVAVADGGYIPSDGRLDLPSCPITPEGMAHHITTALTQLSSFGTPEVLCIGTTGYPEILTEPELLAARLFDTTGLNGLILASDCLTMHVGALGGVAGTVVAAGTGVVTLGTDFDQNWHRVDGWGYLLGDDGSGAWIGRHGLSAALRAYDGRGGSQTLLNLLLENYESIDDAIYRIYDTGTPGRQVAKFAPVVATAAQQGDPLAISIWEQAGQHLAESIAAAHAVVPGAVSWGGGLFNVGDLLLIPFLEHLKRILPDTRITAPRGGSLDGALNLAQTYLKKRHLAPSPYHRVSIREMG